jgi:5-methylcytosine-specific restriction endonuclease McrBC GTP-binding regulatory subunit McrB
MFLFLKDYNRFIRTLKLLESSTQKKKDSIQILVTHDDVLSLIEPINQVVETWDWGRSGCGMNSL